MNSDHKWPKSFAPCSNPGPETNQTLAQRTQSSQWKASGWLLDQQTEDWGWDFLSTGSAILSLQLANETWKNDLESMEAQLTVKQLNIEVLREISHRYEVWGRCRGQTKGYQCRKLSVELGVISTRMCHSPLPDR